VDGDLEPEARPAHVRADQALGPGLGHRLRQPLGAEGELPPHVHEGVVDVEGEAGDGDPLHQLVGVPLDQHPVLERRRLRLVTVDDEVAGLDTGRKE
jgi:hypothetical protein